MSGERELGAAAPVGRPGPKHYRDIGVVERRDARRHRVWRHGDGQPQCLPGALSSAPLPWHHRRRRGLGSPPGRDIARRGVVAGDVVAFQLPNWVEAVACFYGMFALGVVVVPDRAHLRVEGSRCTSCARAGPGPSSPPTASAGRTTWPTSRMRSAGLDDLETIVVVSTDGRPMPTVGPRILSWSEVMAADPGPLDQPASGGPRRPGPDRLHLGDHGCTEGCHPHASHLSGRSTDLGHVPARGRSRHRPPCVRRRRSPHRRSVT